MRCLYLTRTLELKVQLLQCAGLKHHGTSCHRKLGSDRTCDNALLLDADVPEYNDVER